MAFFSGKPIEFYERVFTEARKRICEHYGMTEEQLKKDTVEIMVEDHIDGPWLVTFLVRRSGVMFYQVSINPDELGNGEE